jgi:hypothetical protein
MEYPRKIRASDGQEYTLQELADAEGITVEALIQKIAASMEVPKRPPYTFGVCGHQHPRED